MGVGFDLLEETALQNAQISNLLAADICGWNAALPFMAALNKVNFYCHVPKM